MKQQNPKVLYICCFPALALAVAVMLYLVLGQNRTDDAVFLYGGLIFIAGSALMYLLVGRRINAREAAKEEHETPSAAPEQPAAAPASASSEKAPAGERVNLREHLTAEDIRLMLSDLQVASGKVPADQKEALDALAFEISHTGTVHVKTLPLCVTAVEMGLEVFSNFGLAPAGHSNLLDKLKKLAKAA